MIVGLFLKHIKAYKGINYIPIGEKYNFVSYIGENGIGKSSILEAFNSFFNNKLYPINKSALNDGIFTYGNEPFFAPIFLIDKTKVPRKKNEFEKISKFFWNVKKNDLSSGVQGSMKDFFLMRESILKNFQYSEESHYFFILGEQNITGGATKLYFASFHNEEKFLTHYLEKNATELEGKSSEERKEALSLWKDELNKLLDKNEQRKILQELKDLYSFVYVPVELDIESFTKVETDEMQKIFDKKLKDEITTALSNVKLEGTDGINNKLESFLIEIQSILHDEYEYQTGQQRNNKITKSDLVNKILEAYFQKRVLYRKDKKVSELSAGEKRQALIDIVYAFLIRNIDREKSIIIGIDEPENSLHTSLCYEQFEKLKTISKNNQIFITTHWYGFLPILSQGYGHFLDYKSEKIIFETYDLYDYKAKVRSTTTASKGKLPNNFMLKSTNDLVQAIYYSIQGETPYSWLIVEGISEKYYLEYFFQQEIEEKKLRILPLGGNNNVSEVYEYLELPMREKNESLKGKIWCLIDTDQTRHKDYLKEGSRSLKLRRLSNKNSNIKTELLTLNHSDTSPTDIEQALNPIVFQKAINELSINEKYTIVTIENENGNSDFIKNFKNLELDNLFKDNDGEFKTIFAQKYVEIMLKEAENDSLIPEWIQEIKKYFNE